MAKALEQSSEYAILPESYKNGVHFEIILKGSCGKNMLIGPRLADMIGSPAAKIMPASSPVTLSSATTGEATARTVAMV